MSLSTDNRADWIADKLQAALAPTILEVIDQGWQHMGHAEEGAGHFKVRIASPQFKSLELPECHRLIYRALEGAVGKTIHALQIDIQY
jgi:BolA protein